MDILIFGLGKSGRKLLDYFKDKANIWVYDDKDIDLKELRKDFAHVRLFEEDRGYDLMALSPGPSPEHFLIKDFRKKGIPIVGEVGLALEKIQGKLLVITGTNGKTTTTSLVKEMVKRKNPRTFAGGNIGEPLIGFVEDSRANDAYVVELSSFQLDSLGRFNPYISVILNITPDHISWHGSMENYIQAKMQLWSQNFNSQLKIINGDDKLLLSETEKYYKSMEDFYYFSTKEKVRKGAYVENGKIFLAIDQLEEVLPIHEISLKGEHNLANALAASLMARLYGVDLDDIKYVLRNFQGLEHRYEILEEKLGRRFINDSKATNVDSSLPAYRSAQRPTVLIAGGLDKKVPLEPLFEDWNPAIKEVVIFGEVKKQMFELARRVAGAHMVDNLEEAFDLALNLSETGWDILFSPACASWDMYESFEQRGEHFKELLGRI